MIDITQKKVRSGKSLIYATVLLAAGQSILLHLGTTDYGHKIISVYFVIEVLILGFTLFLGLKNRWTRMILVILTVWETILFFQDPISPDNLLMIVIWILRVYVIVTLFGRTMNQYYKADN